MANRDLSNRRKLERNAHRCNSRRLWQNAFYLRDMARPPFPGGKTPLSLSDEELDLLLALAAPIDQTRRQRFLEEVAKELEASTAQIAVGPGVGGVNRIVDSCKGAFSTRPSSARANTGFEIGNPQMSSRTTFVVILGDRRPIW